jgi:glucose-6-phosphate 1-dehydrogenase
MHAVQSDALVFFGATGDLAYKRIFPSIRGLISEGLNVPIIGVAKSGWSPDQLRARAKDSLEHHRRLDQKAFEKLVELLRYVECDYPYSGTFARARKELDSAKQPLHCLVVPPNVPARLPKDWRNPDALRTRES